MASEVIQQDAEQQFKIFKECIMLAKHASNERMGLLWLSKRPDSILMWSHYSSCHTGYVLGFTVKKDPLFFAAPFAVKYQEDYPSLSYIQNMKESAATSFIAKAAEWSYEQEIRIIRPNPKFYHFKKECLTEIILGNCVTEENKQRIINLLSEPAYEHVVLKQAKVSHMAFALQIETISK